jgi:hypothetical protein
MSVNRKYKDSLFTDYLGSRFPAVRCRGNDTLENVLYGGQQNDISFHIYQSFPCA